MKTTFVFRRHWIKINFNQKISLDHPEEFQVFFHTVTCSLPSCLVCFETKTKEFHGCSTICLKDPTEPEEQKYLASLYGLRFRQFRCFLIGTGLSCRDSNESLHKHGQTPENSRYALDLVSDLAARNCANCSTSPAQLVFVKSAFGSNKKKTAHHITRFVLFTEIFFFAEDVNADVTRNDSTCLNTRG